MSPGSPRSIGGVAAGHVRAARSGTRCRGDAVDPDRVRDHAAIRCESAGAHWMSKAHATSERSITLMKSG